MVYSILLFSLIALIIFFACPKKFRNVWIFLSSFCFYAWIDHCFALLIAMEILVTFAVAKKIAANISAKAVARRFLFLGIGTVIAILCFFKYFNFFVDAFDFSVAKFALPLGISYYSFKAISYMADVYLGKREEEHSLVDYGAYISFFPQLMCGPIARSQGMLEQLKTGLGYNSALCQQGIVLIVSGLFKKVVIADRVAGYVDDIFATAAIRPSFALMLAAVLYAVQLYCDFAGYSEIAIGTTNLFGIKCDSNFNRPYLSRSIRDFWRRWHISLSSWLRDYIYIPLGGSRCSNAKIWRNTFATFIVCGIWHGSALHYVLWGAYHGLLNMLTPRKLDVKGRLKSVAYWFFTMILVTIGWIFFKAETAKDAILYLGYIFKNFSVSVDAVLQSILPFTQSNTCVSYFFITLVMLGILFLKEYREEHGKGGHSIWFALQLACIILFGFTGNNAFLYANF